MSMVVWWMLALAGTASGLFEDQAGLFDWRTELVGPARYIQQLNDGTVVAASRMGGLAALSAKDGSILWRQSTPRDYAVDYMTVVNSAACLVCRNGSRLMTFDVESGAAIADVVIRSMADEDPVPALTLARPTWDGRDGSVHVDTLKTGASHFIVVASGTSLSLVAPAKGSLYWQTSCDGAIASVGMDVTNNMVYALTSSSTGYSVVAFDTDAKSQSVKLDSISSSSCQLLGTHLVCLSEGSIRTLALDKHTPSTGGEDSQAAWQSLSLTKVTSMTKAEADRLLVGTANGQYTVLLEADRIQLIATPSGSFVSTSANVAAINGRVEVSTEGAKFTSSLPYNFASTAMAASARNGRVVVSFVNGLMLAMDKQSQKPLWSRLEGLADIAACSFLDLPPDETEQELFGTAHNPVASLTARWLSTISDIVKLARGLTGSDDDSDQLVTDLFRLHKLILLTDAKGTTYGLDSRQGRVRWVLPALVDNARVVSASLHQLRSAAQRQSIVAIALRSDSELHVSFVDGLTGRRLEQPEYRAQSFAASHMVHLLPVTEGSVRVLGVVGRDSVTVYPSTATTRAALGALPQDVYFHTMDADTGLIKGSTIKNGTVHELWQISFSPLDERIVASATAPPGDRAASAGDILGDKTVLFKYLNPNLLAVATLSPYVKRKATLTVYVIDTVKGVFIDRVQHSNVRGPVTMATSENWVLYSYRDRANKRNQLSVIEFFDSKGQASEAGFSSLAGAQPIVMRQSFAFTDIPQAMTVTQTNLGITQRNVILTLPSGGLMTLPRPMFNARRPTSDKAAERAVGLPKYNPLIPVSHRNILNYHQSLVQVHDVVVAPSGLESTSLVFAHGLDLFLTQIAPSKQFDRLNYDFAHVGLAATLVGLVVLTKVLASLAARKRLNEQ
eukprot:TRINITY_DN8301_c0_g2_i2.p1 TRINITY_DN8301_c0_g2~~TRINITY_DN8301_c0_g2_i2.p1  ORF type:complete len:902 (+),score=173.38 TRINITY_DN8301_c0_g2_i2:2-2707(+)